MGKSMSTAKQVSRSAPKKIVVTPITQQNSNTESVRRAAPVPTLPTSAYLEKANSLDKSFNDRLKQVYVTSINKNPNLDLPKDRSLPMDRTIPYASTPHSQITEKRTPNTLLVDDLKKILYYYKSNPQKWTVDYIAARYDISREIAEKMVTNYSTLETFYANAPSESDKYLQREEPVKRINLQTSIDEMQEIVVDKRRKWKTQEEVLEEFRK